MQSLVGKRWLVLDGDGWNTSPLGAPATPVVFELQDIQLQAQPHSSPLHNSIFGSLWAIFTAICLT